MNISGWNYLPNQTIPSVNAPVEAIYLKILRAPCFHQSLVIASYLSGVPDNQNCLSATSKLSDILCSTIHSPFFLFWKANLDFPDFLHKLGFKLETTLVTALCIPSAFLISYLFVRGPKY